MTKTSVFTGYGKADPVAKARRMVYEFGRFVFLAEYEDRHIPKAARFFWDGRRGAWVTESFRCASGLLMYADEDAKRRILDRVVGAGVDRSMEIPGRGGRINRVRHP